jgi:ElaB/YqjD/DUF883 family membrane-anchored ribosome-binding protein
MTDNLRAKASERYNQARGKAEDALATGRAKASEAREKANEALTVGREKVRETAAATRERARAAAQKTGESLESNPLAAVAGGLAIGAVIAAMLPRTARENKLLGPVSRSVRATAKTATKVAGNVAKAELVGLGVSSETARKQVRTLAGKLGKAASTASAAAVKTVRKDKE